jgi:hypothetical protein
MPPKQLAMGDLRTNFQNLGEGQTKLSEAVNKPPHSVND